MKRLVASLLIVVAAVSLLALAGCGKDEVQKTGLTAEEEARRRAEEEARRRAAMAREQALAARQAFYNEDVHYDYDRSEIKPEGQQVLQRKAQYMRANPEIKVTIEGHCDERGSQTYNMALGDRRAKAAIRYLISLGVPASRMRTVSYGKERPMCREHNEACWSRNRRAHFIDQ